MSESLIINILLSLIGATVGVIGFMTVSRVHRGQIESAKTAVDAEAYIRAKEIYEGALDLLRQEVSSYAAEMASTREEITRLRVSNQTLTIELSRMKESNNELTAEVHNLRKELAALRSGH